VGFDGVTSASIRRMVESIEEIGRHITPLLREHGVVRAGIFGSHARGTATPSSDLDVVVEFECGRTLLDLVRLREDLIKALGLEADVVTYRSLHPRLRDRILGEQVRVL
jgi:predicted nucleotidyltransferase